MRIELYVRLVYLVPPETSTFNLQPSTFNLQPSTFNLQPSTFNLQPSTFNFQQSLTLRLGCISVPLLPQVDLFIVRPEKIELINVRKSSNFPFPFICSPTATCANIKLFL
jgi:hypothetical protein